MAIQKTESLQNLKNLKKNTKTSYYKDKEYIEETKKIENQYIENLEKERVNNFVKKYKDINIIDNSKTFKNFIFEKEDKNLEYIKKYLQNFEEAKRQGIGIALVGEVGTGKSHLANSVANYLISKNFKVLITNLTSYLSNIKEGYNKNTDYENLILKSINNFDLLILDDMGVEKIGSGGWELEKINNLIEKRKGYPLVITSNFNLDKLSKHYEKDGFERIGDRLKEMCFQLEFKGESYRKKIKNKKFANIMKG